MRRGPVYDGGKTGDAGRGCPRCLRFPGKASVSPVLLLFLLLAEPEFPLRVRLVPTAVLCSVRLPLLLPLELEGLLGLTYERRPVTKDFIDLLADYLKKHAAP